VNLSHQDEGGGQLKRFQSECIPFLLAGAEAQKNLLETFIALAEASAPTPKREGFHPLVYSNCGTALKYFSEPVKMPSASPGPGIFHVCSRGLCCGLEERHQLRWF
jgi:hypothetical protein